MNNLPIEDKEAIRELLSEYCFRMDDFRFAELGALFTEDGDWIAPYARARGPAEIAALMARNIPGEPKRKHFIMNSLIRLDGDRAGARTSYLVVLQATGAGLVPSVAGTYDDVAGAYDRRLALPRAPTGPRPRGRARAQPAEPAQRAGRCVTTRWRRTSAAGRASRQGTSACYGPRRYCLCRHAAHARLFPLRRLRVFC